MNASTEHSTTYRDPKNRFTLTVPAGWKTQALGDGVQIVRGDSYESVVVFENATDAGAMVDDLQSQIGKKWQKFDVTKRADSTLGGQKASVLWATGMNPHGQEAFIKFTGVINGKVGLVLVSGFLKSEGKMADTLTGIESSFELASGTTAAVPSVRPTLGIEVTDLSAEDAREYKLDGPKGVLILQIEAGGPAEKAGLKLYDVILELDGQSIDGAATLQEIVRSHKVGDTVELHGLRAQQGNTVQSIAATVAVGAGTQP